MEVVRIGGRGNRWGTGRTATAAWRRIRHAVLERDGYRCRYCGGPASTVDHVVPVFRGGSDDESNLVAACVTCHRSKTGREARAAQGTRRRPRDPQRHPGLID